MENYTFCSRCGRTIPVPRDHDRVPFECPTCRTLDWSVPERPKLRPIGGSRDGDIFYVVTYPMDLGPPRRSYSIEKWPERAFIALSEGYESILLVTRWIFRAEMEPAVRRILWVLRRRLVMVEERDGGS